MSRDGARSGPGILSYNITPTAGEKVLMRNNHPSFTQSSTGVCKKFLKLHKLDRWA